MPRTVDYGNGTRLTADYNSQRQQIANYKVQQVASDNTLLEQYYDYYENGINSKVRRLADNANFANHRKFFYDGFNRLTAFHVNNNPMNQLLARGANPVLRNKEGKTALAVAKERKHRDVVKLLQNKASKR